MIEMKSDRLRVEIPGERPRVFKSGAPDGEVGVVRLPDDSVLVVWVLEKPQNAGDGRVLSAAEQLYRRVEGPFPSGTALTWE